jgi:hypothetical protein
MKREKERKKKERIKGRNSNKEIKIENAFNSLSLI